MSNEQPRLFGNLAEPGSKSQPAGKYMEVDLPFLPGIKTEDSINNIKDYQELDELIKKCERCRLRGTCQQVVIGDGDIHADIMFIGEGPGQDEDRQGLPFVGRAGQLLNKILVASEFNRPESYITNVVKCRPPGNRLPNPDEVKECRKLLELQISIIKPKIIVCLGSLACQTVIDPKAKISKTRGKWFIRNGIKIIASYHPAALLRNEGYKRPTWEDFKLIRDEYKSLKDNI
ncbi:MAG: uracil-DNA glycosylase [Syntrophomonas sp.]|nr:uracil-DNA glycosylase [Syntrophomonas sp.]